MMEGRRSEELTSELNESVKDENYCEFSERINRERVRERERERERELDVMCFRSVRASHLDIGRQLSFWDFCLGFSFSD